MTYQGGLVTPRAIGGYVIACPSAVLTFAARAVDLEPYITPRLRQYRKSVIWSCLWTWILWIGMVCREIAIFRGISGGPPFCLYTLAMRTLQTLKTFLWIRWVVSLFTEMIICCLLILFLPVCANSSCSPPCN